MRINSIPRKELYYQYVHVKEKTAPLQSGYSMDRVELTGEAKTFSATMKAVREAMETSDPAKAGKIERIKQQIENKEYSVPGQLVAEKMLGKL
ncbi:MAG: flagellar biosynthesis anti-sigma factor FlgM [Christensenellales bacterium]|jgi:anti-sigma28 factor (negative regulator of flagellin synthesis)